MKVKCFRCQVLQFIAVLHCSEDEDALLLAELAKGKKEKEMAKLKEVYC